MELIPIFLGGLFFLVCGLGGIIYAVFIGRGKARWRGIVAIAVGLIGLFPLLVVLPPPFMTMKSVSGTYAGDLGGGNETFVLHPNGTFDQTVDDGSGSVRQNYGTWKLDTIQEGSLDFDHLYMPQGFAGFDEHAQVSNFGGASVHLIGGTIYFNEDLDQSIHRIKSNTERP